MAPQPQRSPGAGAMKLTWSERQALAKTQAAEDEALSRGAAFKTAPAPPFVSSAPTFGRAVPAASAAARNLGSATAGAAVQVGTAALAMKEAVWDTEKEEDEEEAQVSCCWLLPFCIWVDAVLTAATATAPASAGCVQSARGARP